MKQNYENKALYMKRKFKKCEQFPLILAEITEHKNDHYIWRWKTRPWLETGTNMWRG